MEDQERFYRSGDISPPLLPWREGKKGRREGEKNRSRRNNFTLISSAVAAPAELDGKLMEF